MTQGNDDKGEYMQTQGRFRLRGINYDTGTIVTEHYSSRPHFDSTTARRELQIIRDDLYCNAVRISGSEQSRLIKTAEIALELGLEVWFSPTIHDKTPEETLAITLECAHAIEKLRKRWPHIVFVIGSELTWFMQGIMKGNTFIERVGNPFEMLKLKLFGFHNKPLNAYLGKAASLVREIFHGPITYASAPIEKVDWNVFDFVSLDYYRGAKNRDSYGERLKRHLEYRKPVVITELGTCAYKGAENKGGRAFAITDYSDPKHPKVKGNYVRDEALQAHEIIDMLTIVSNSGVEGAFVFTFVSPVLTHSTDPTYDLDLASYAIVKSFSDSRGQTYEDMLWEPKAAFKELARYYHKMTT